MTQSNRIGQKKRIDREDRVMNQLIGTDLMERMIEKYSP